MDWNFLFLRKTDAFVFYLLLHRVCVCVFVIVILYLDALLGCVLRVLSIRVPQNAFSQLA